MADRSSPLLSICIPTYNRAELLRSALHSVVRQAARIGAEVEVVVADNCSTDNTTDVVEWARQFGEIRYYRNQDNFGVNYNILQLVNSLAKGEFCWLLGDDDLVR